MCRGPCSVCHNEYLGSIDVPIFPSSISFWKLDAPAQGARSHAWVGVIERCRVGRLHIAKLARV